jgi:hypothetical protein
MTSAGGDAIARGCDGSKKFISGKVTARVFNSLSDRREHDQTDRRLFPRCAANFAL